MEATASESLLWFLCLDRIFTLGSLEGNFLHYKIYVT